MSCCNGPCFIKYATQVGKILIFLWNHPLKDILKEVVDESQPAKPSELTADRATSIRSAQFSRPVSPFLTF